MNSGGNVWFPAVHLALLGEARVIDFPRTEKSARLKARRLKWQERQTPCQGGKSGYRAEFHPPQDILEAIWIFLKEHPDFLTKGKTGKQPLSQQYSIKPAKPLVVRNEESKYRRYDDYQPSSFSDFVLVPEYDVRASAGGGSIINSEQIIGHLAFKKRWVTTILCCNPKDLVLITVKGDSMEPSLNSNDLILVNTSIKQMTEHGIYVLQYGDSLLVKRIQRKINGTLLITSDNPDYQNEELDESQAESLNVLGIVVWYGRKM